MNTVFFEFTTRFAQIVLTPFLLSSCRRLGVAEAGTSPTPDDGGVTPTFVPAGPTVTPTESPTGTPCVKYAECCTDSNCCKYCPTANPSCGCDVGRGCDCYPAPLDPSCTSYCRNPTARIGFTPTY
jgi:hypothetical protein